MGEGVVNGSNARVVLVEVTGIQTVSAMGDRRRVEFHLVLQWGNQRLHDILTKPLTLQNNIANFRDNDGVEHQRADAGLLIDGVNLFLNCPRAADIFDERQRKTIRNIKNVAINSIIHFAHPGADIIL